MVDNGSSADYPTFQQMRINKEHLVPTNAPFVGFGGTKVYPLSLVTLPVTIGDYPQQIIKDVTFLVVDCSSAYNAIIGWPTLNSWKAITSTYHLMIKLSTEYGVGELWGDQVLYCNAGDGRPFIDHEYRRTTNKGRTCGKAQRDTPQQLQTRQNHKDQHSRQPNSSLSTHSFPQGEPRCVCLESWRHARNRPFNHGA